MSETISRGYCKSCKSTNNLCTWKYNEKLFTKCQTPGCTYSEASSEEIQNSDIKTSSDQNNKQGISIIGEFKDIVDRKISKNTCEIYNYQVGMYKGRNCHIANVYNKEVVITSQHVRFIDSKQFEWINYNQNITLFGSHIEFDYEKPVIITEGQIDAMSCYEMGFQSLSLTHGIDTAEQGLLNYMEELKKFKKIILWFDNDEPGINKLKEILDIMPLGKTFYVDLKKDKQLKKYKDANDVYINVSKADDFSYLNSLIKEYVPQGIKFGNNLILEEYLTPLPEGLMTGRPVFDQKTRGYKFGQLYLFMAGSGIGKSTILRNDILLLRRKYGVKVANFFLEDRQRVSELGYVAMDLNIPIVDFIDNPCKYATIEDIKKSWNEIINTEDMAFRDVNCSLDSKKFLKQIEYLVDVKKYKVIVLDHIQALTEEDLDEQRIAIDKFMSSFHKLIIKYNFIGIIACQLSNPSGQGKDWEEGREVTQSDARGSASLRFKPDVMIGLERNSRDESEKDKLKLRIVKCRYGDTGLTDEIRFVENTGRLQVL